ncbi:hypothetical protein SAMN05216251_108234 [Actinacidiphila alni]|uniref:Uncharacterized protein n=1 Tax=Actinacidiphila alni TaxID=380248 RepID=A0A1I2G3T0_9ACTN|nr:hypothetical protein [Actinacidiphila alni]SFF11789.1 hypothetical protein SAMN05216251_108234 [Actinacidiphila alni]
MNTTGLTLAGLAAALVVLYANLRPWWAGNRDAKQLAAFGKGSALGIVSAVCPGGILGWAHTHSATAANEGGSRLTSGTTGVQTTAPVAHRALSGLTPAGAVVVVVIAFGVVLAWRAAGKKDKKRIVGGAFVASVLCLSAGVVGLLTWVPGTLNSIGNSIQGAL